MRKALSLLEQLLAEFDAYEARTDAAAWIVREAAVLLGRVQGMLQALVEDEDAK